MKRINAITLFVLVAIFGLARALALPPTPAGSMSTRHLALQPIALPRIGLPIERLRSTDLRDSFNELHNGHRHEAIDLMAPRGTRVLAVTGGRIEKLFLSKAGGKTIYEFDDSNTYCYYYAHLDHYAAELSERMNVSQGTIIVAWYQRKTHRPMRRICIWRFTG
jgi:murein DD-endopeptidase MepM/ murein hydrolase activator NlpD